MFYSSEILNIKSNSRLGIVWLAGTIGPKSNTAKKLGRRDLNNVSIQETCAYMIAPPNPFSLRLSANLMIGVSRVYGQQCFYHMSDVQGLCSRLTHQTSSNAPESIDLPPHEKKGINISINKIECISAVNFPSGCDVLNFSDLDLNTILSSTLDYPNPTKQLNIQSTPEIGRFNANSTSSSITASHKISSILHDSDFSNVMGPVFMDMNDGFDNELLDYLPLRSNSSASSNLEFHIPEEIKTTKTSYKPRRLNLMDDSDNLMLNKDELFISSADFYSNSKKSLFFTESSEDPSKKAMKLLNNPSDLELNDVFSNILRIDQFFDPKIAKQENKNNKANNNNNNIDDMNMNDDYYDDVEVFRNDLMLQSSSSSNTPNMFQLLPWSMSMDSSNNASSILNTPIKKNTSHSQTLLYPHSDNASSSTASSTTSSPFKITDTTNNETLNFFQYLQERIIEDNKKLKGGGLQKNPSTIYFDKLIELTSPNRHLVSRAFYHLLELKSSDLIDLNQSKPFSSIKISIK